VVENVLAQGEQLNQLEKTQQPMGFPNKEALQEWEVANQQQILAKQEINLESQLHVNHQLTP
jgi:hypothetical protein